MPELQIAFLEVPFDALSSSATSEDSDYPHENLFFGGSSLLYKTSSTATSNNIDLDLGSGFTSSIDYLILRGCNLLVGSAGESNAGVSIIGSTDNFSSSNNTIFSNTTIETSDLTGPRTEDLILSGSTSTAYRYWRVQTTSTGSVYHTYRKIYCGNLFDFGGISPVYPYSPNYSDTLKGFTSDSGALFKTTSGYRRRVYTFTWNGVTDAYRDEFDSKVNKYANDFPVYLYQPSSATHSPLNGHDLVCCWIDSVSWSSGEWKDVNSVTVSFVEDIA